MRLQWKCCKDRRCSEKRAEWDYVEKTSKTEGEVIDAKRTAKSAKRLKAVDRRVIRRRFFWGWGSQFRPRIVIWGWGATSFGAV